MEEKTAKGKDIIQDLVYEAVKKVHKQILEQVMILQGALNYLHDEKAYKDIEKVVDFFKDKILAHWEWEDHHVFPIALMLGDLNQKQIVRELQRDHIDLLSRFDVMVDIVTKHGFRFADEDAKRKFVDVSKEIIALMLKHAEKEDANLYPFLMKKGVQLKGDPLRM